MPILAALPRAVIAAAAAVTALAGCSSDGESEPTTATVPRATPGVPATDPTSAPTVVEAPVVEMSGDATAQQSVSAPATDEPPQTAPPTDVTATTDPTPPAMEPPGTPSEQETTTTLDARTRAADELAAALPDAAQVGVPADWSVRDLQAGADESSIPPSELDPFRDVVRCPDGFIDLRRGGPWAERKFNGLDPSPEGVLIVRAQLVAETSDDWAERRRQLGACSPVSVDAFAERAPATITLDGGEQVPAARLAVFSSATGDSPFPTQVVYVTAHADDVTATVSFFGLNEADTFDDAALALLEDVLTAASG